MGKIVKFKELGFNSFDDYKEEFFRTLLPSNKTYEYFVDWNKVKRNLKRYLNELSLLNSLTKLEESDRKKHLKELLIKYPRIVEVIPLLIAVRTRNGRIEIFDDTIEQILWFEFKSSVVSRRTIPKIINFCVKTGVIKLFEEIRDIHDYLLGVEVGLDTNARKNRSGYIFEKMCRQKLRKLLGNAYKIVNNDPNFTLYPVIEKGKGKTHDIVIYKHGKPILVGEFSFYNTAGSKPISISESYIEMNKAAKEQGMEFLWVTDGPAWKEMKERLLYSMQKIDWILNYRMLERINRILK